MPFIPAVPAMPVKFGATDMTFLGQTYHLASYNQKSNPMWEFVPPADNINDWKTLLTVIDRPDARTRPDLDRLAEGVMAAYKSRGGQILLAKTMQTHTGEVFNYLVAATKAREFLNQQSGEVGRALGEAPLPDLSSLPRREF